MHAAAPSVDRDHEVNTLQADMGHDESFGPNRVRRLNHQIVGAKARPNWIRAMATILKKVLNAHKANPVA